MGAEFCSEQRLQLYALTDAIGFLRHEDYGRETLAWLLDDAPDATFSFVGICESLGYDAGHLRSRLLAYLASDEPFPYIRGEEVVDIVALLAGSEKRTCPAGHAFTARGVFISFDLHGPQIRCRLCNAEESRQRHEERARKEWEEYERRQGSIFADIAPPAAPVGPAAPASTEDFRLRCEERIRAREEFERRQGNLFERATLRLTQVAA